MSCVYTTFYPFIFKLNNDEIKEALRQLKDTLKNDEDELERGEQNADTQTDNKSLKDMCHKARK